MQGIGLGAGSGGREIIGVLLTFLTVVGCGGSSTDPALRPLLQSTVHDGFVFLTQNRQPSGAMEALFSGSVIADAVGCFRLNSEEGATVVWPLNYSLDTSGDVPRVLNDEGSEVGMVGQAFVLAGGLVNELPDAMGFTARDRERAQVCPGRYWIVNDES